MMDSCVALSPYPAFSQSVERLLPREDENLSCFGRYIVDAAAADSIITAMLAITAAVMIIFMPPVVMGLDI